MHWDDLKIVLALSRCHSLKQAGQALGIDQSTVSRRLAALEASLGSILFTRSRQGFSLTDAGDEVLSCARRMELAELALTAQLEGLGREPVGMVRVVTNYWIATALLAPRLGELLARHPKLQVRLIGDTRGRSLGNREVELGLWFEMGVDGPELALAVGTLDYAVYCRSDLDADRAGWVSFWDPDATRVVSRWLEERLGEGERLLMTANDAQGVLAAIRAGIGKGLVPVCLARQWPELRCLSPGGVELTRRLFAVVHPDMTGSVRIQATLGWLRQLLAAAQGTDAAP